ncbi:type II toxin-antitoxin system Phd/YefM family antitoxin [Geminocystis sp. NIES-3709]|uniref:type II toxin-antitoxin system Phd/YefM family antitoxin n=1 Tax=Geminocystis sp. NIES-3709 TaxID=1617448 RepID=UPI0009EC475A
MFSIKTSYTQARENLANLLDKIENDSSIAVIKRRGHKDIALISADDLSSLLETIYLLRSPSNAQRLLLVFHYPMIFSRDKLMETVKILSRMNFNAFFSNISNFRYIRSVIWYCCHQISNS